MAEFKQCEECTRPTNNQYFNCPPRMSDGRHFTDYRPRCTQAYDNKLKDQLMSSYDYRMFLTQNAENIINKNAFNAYMTNRCGPCVEPYNEGTMLPELEQQICNTRTCTFKTTDPYGLGLGRKTQGETVPDVRQQFIAEKEKENQYFKQNAQCCATVQDSMMYYPVDGSVMKQYPRTAVPSGAIPMTGGDMLKN